MLQRCVKATVRFAEDEENEVMESDDVQDLIRLRYTAQQSISYGSLGETAALETSQSHRQVTMACRKLGDCITMSSYPKDLDASNHACKPVEVNRHRCKTRQVAGAVWMAVENTWKLMKSGISFLAATPAKRYAVPPTAYWPASSASYLAN